MSILDHFIAVAPYMSQLMLEDVHFCIADREKFVVSLPGKKLKMALYVGDPIRDGSLTKVALEEKRRIFRQGNKELYGVAHNAICLPLIENGEAVGCISIGISQEKNDKISQIAQSLAAMTEQISASAQSISQASQQLAVMTETMADTSVTVHKQMEDISEVTKFVFQVASQTNLLGLNASIQAAHAGEYGKGFSVVAQEIRNLAERSGESAKRIAGQLKQIQDLISSMLQSIEESGSLTEENAASTEELAASIEELNSLAKKLSELSELQAGEP
ncbi:methyl-accepting chemotaxis protein [Brevibacillus massiliensis]|uniref:methyl-accepting chemotaxis protein n=1 Tax=Brevibacillus massiliensis TaxID=1118054 RepID=UPI0002DDD066|nr:methyl-accepting chemotaxis protein [Brevibacillus massiliensis]